MCFSSCSADCFHTLSLACFHTSVWLCFYKVSTCSSGSYDGRAEFSLMHGRHNFYFELHVHGSINFYRRQQVCNLAYSDAFSTSPQNILFVCNDSCKFSFTVWSVSSAVWCYEQIFYDQIGTNTINLSCEYLRRDRCDLTMASRIAPSAAIKANRHMSFIGLYQGLLRL